MKIKSRAPVLDGVEVDVGLSLDVSTHRSYSPIDNVQAGVTYPQMLLVSGLNDPRVAYWEPAKWAQVLRHEIANGDETLVKMDMSAGHFSAADRYRYLRELAFDYAWLLDVFGKSE